jgi:molybdopterin synthase sulfur carrier subunit
MSLQLRVQVFARLREQLGRDEVLITLAEPATVASLRLAIGEQLAKEFTNLIGVSAVAVNGEYASNQLALKSTDEIALIPPVSGG